MGYHRERLQNWRPRVRVPYFLYFFLQALLNIMIVHELLNADWANLGI